ncbi:MAG: TolB family protein [Thermoanaerobaculia bacterium]
MRSFLLALLLLAAPVLAQSPAADWRTIETPHFRVHYPAESETWARRSAARLESIRERVAAEIGYTPEETVDVLVSDPVAEANGMALPFLGWPRLVLWTSPPGPESTIGHYSEWSELLVVHEEAHLVHLLRPSRNPWRQLLARVVPVSPIVLGAPRWVIEGYATVVEGRLTASGRPNSDLRAGILRRWAQAGKLPSYGRLANDDQSWLGGSMAYLVGSAYLEWLEERAGPGSLRNLWARMTARRARSFDDAFEGVFGDSPADLYDRFRAEITWKALEAERLAERRIGEAHEGELWQDLSWNVGDPAVSPDGKRLAIVLGSRDLPDRLVVWSTEPNEKAEKEWEERRKEILERDPEDVPAERTKPLPREALYTLHAGDGVEPAMPRWMPDGESLLFVRFEPDPEGFLHPDLFLWTPGSGEVRRITREADLRFPDPSPDGTWAVAVRHRHGLSQLVRVELATGKVQEITPPSIEEVYDRPRIAPDGSRIAFVRHREGAWRLVIRELASGEERTLAPPRGGTMAAPAWGADTIYAVVGDRGFIDVWAFPLDGGEPGPVTRTAGAAFAPAPSPDGLFYLSLEPDGLDLRRIVPGRAASLPDLPPELAPVIRPPAPAPPEPFATAEVPEPRPYGLGRQELLPLIGGSASSSGGTFELGVRGGDVVGRLDWLALGAISGSDEAEGGALAAAWRGWPIEVGFHLFRADESDLDRRGAELSARWDRRWSGGALRLDGRTLFGQVESLDQEIASLSAGAALFRRRGSWWLETGIAAVQEQGSTDGDGWSRSTGRARFTLAHDDTRLSLSWRRGTSSDIRQAFDLFQLGGAETSLLPESALSGRVFVPALPAGTLLGEEHEGQRAELTLGFLPAPIFFERHRLWSRGGPRGDWLSLAGLEWRWSIAPIPLGRVPGLDVRLGVARILEDPSLKLEDETRWWVVTVWRP